MDTLSPLEIAESLNVIIQSLEEDENTYYVAIEIAHQLRDEISRSMDDSE